MKPQQREAQTILNNFKINYQRSHDLKVLLMASNA